MQSNPDASHRIGLAIMARAPVPGEAKTRLISVLGADGAARLQGWLLQHTVAMALAADIGPVTLWCTGNERHPDFAACKALGPIELRKQPEGHLGERMLAAVANATTPAGTLVIGTDCPALTTDHLKQAAHFLTTHDAVVGPAEDGGYVLIGMRSPLADVFNGIDWGTGQVMTQTRWQLRKIGLRWHELDLLWDLDRPDDLMRLYDRFPNVPEFRNR